MYRLRIVYLIENAIMKHKYSRIIFITFYIYLNAYVTHHMFTRQMMFKVFIKIKKTEI